MERLARLFPLRAFGRLRHLRGLVPCSALLPRGAAALDAIASMASTPSAMRRRAQSGAAATLAGPDWCSSAPGQGLPSKLPAFARVTLRHGVPQPAGSALCTPGGSDPVRVYRGPSRLVLVGHIDAVCSLIDRCIAAEVAGVGHGLID